MCELNQNFMNYGIISLYTLNSVMNENFTLIMFYRHTFILYTLMALIKEYTKNDTFTKKKTLYQKMIQRSAFIK